MHRLATIHNVTDDDRQTDRQTQQYGRLKIKAFGLPLSFPKYFPTAENF